MIEEVSNRSKQRIGERRVSIWEGKWITFSLVWSEKKMRMWGRERGGKIRSDFSGEILLLRMNGENFQRET